MLWTSLVNNCHKNNSLSLDCVEYAIALGWGVAAATPTRNRDHCSDWDGRRHTTTRKPRLWSRRTGKSTSRQAAREVGRPRATSPDASLAALIKLLVLWVDIFVATPLPHIATQICHTVTLPRHECLRWGVVDNLINLKSAYTY